MQYWDTSALVPLLVQQPQSPQVHAHVRSDAALVTWWATPVEIWSGLCRLQRSGDFSESQTATLRERLHHLTESLDIVVPSAVVRERAYRLLRMHPLHAADALQLAAALQWCQERPDGRVFLCFDERLRLAASREGFQVLPA